MKAIDILQEEHSAALTMLDNLECASDAAERGVAVPAEVFNDVLEFMRVFVDRCHHGKEEGEIFPRLRSSSAALLADQLQAEHQQGRMLAAVYAETVRAYIPGNRATGKRVQSAAHAYGAFLRGHIMTETAELLPSMEDQLGSEDGRLVEAFEQLELDQIGPGTHERLHRLIDSVNSRTIALESASAVWSAP